MRIESEIVENLVTEASRLQIAAIKPADRGRINVNSELLALRERLAQRIDQYLQPWFVLLDESIQFFVQFESYLFEAPLSSDLTGFAITVSKLKRDVISIRELLLIGQDATARIVARAMVEDVEIAMALALSAETCAAFAGTDDSNDFWIKHIGHGRVKEKLLQYLAACEIDEQSARALLERHRAAKKHFSESVHGGKRSSLASAFAPSLTNPDELHFLSLGAVTGATADLALFVARETQIFAGSVVKGRMTEKPLHLFREFRITGRFMNAAGSAYVLQSLLTGHEHQMETERAKFS